MDTIKSSLICGILLVSFGCGQPAENTTSENPQSSPRQESPSSSISPNQTGKNVDEKTQNNLTEAVNSYFQELGVNVENDETYKTEYIDLNDDGIKDALVLMSTQDWCGTGGCNLFIFQGGENKFEFLSSSSLIHQPFTVSKTQTNGWRDLVVEVRGGGAKPQTVTLKFDGKLYPSNPSLEPPINSEITVEGVQVFPIVE
ncbi:MAG: hypothetical protein AAGJ08_14115 [Cyanobacteria bacterium P01_H01_bin.35]